MACSYGIGLRGLSIALICRLAINVYTTSSIFGVIPQQFDCRVYSCEFRGIYVELRFAHQILITCFICRNGICCCPNFILYTLNCLCRLSSSCCFLAASFVASILIFTFNVHQGGGGDVCLDCLDGCAHVWELLQYVFEIRSVWNASGSCAQGIC
jgi:hypothetical protein